MNFHRTIAPALVALTLAFSTAAMAQAPDPASAPAQTPHHHRTRAEWDAVMQQRMAMIEALEVTHDDAALTALLNGDKDLENYGILLRRTAGYLHDPRLLEKLLDFPTLDKTSPEYIRAVSGRFAEFAANGASEIEVKLATMMFERIKNDQAAVDDALYFIVRTSAMFTVRPVDTGLAKLLVQQGGDLNGAIADVTKAVLSNNDPLLQRFTDERLARLEKFRAAVTAPATPQPAPQTFAPKG